MADIAQLGLEIQTGGVVRARRELDGLTAAGGRAEGMATRLSAGFGGFARFAGPIGIVGAAVALGGRQALITADAYTSLAGRLALVTGGGERLLRVQAALFEQAQRTRSDVAATTDLYGSLARSTQALGISQDRLLRVTESINQALIVSGASGSSAQAALVQLGQGFASGTLRGEELNSILEQTPRLAQAIADGLGVPLGKLRQLGQEGKLTAEAVFGALERAGAGLAAEFGRMPTTIAQAQTQVSNSMGALVSSLDRLTGTTPRIASWLSMFSKGLDGISQRINRSGGVFAGYADALEEGFKQARLQAAVERLDELSAGVVRAQQVLEKQPDSIWAKSTIGDFNRVRDEAVALYIELNRLTSTAAPDLSQDAAETAKFLRQIQRPGAGPDPKKGRDTFADELAARRERISLIGQETEVERTAVQISVGAYGKLTKAQREQLLALAAAEDARRGHVDALRSEADARQRIGELSERLASQQRSETEALIAGNATLRDEIETLGATEQAKAAIEQARIRSQRVLLEEALAQRLNAGETEADIGFLRQQIELLRQREALIGQRADRRSQLDAEAEAKRINADMARDARQDLTAALSAAFRDTSGNPLRAFSDAVGNALYTRVTARMADALVTSLVGLDGSGGWLAFLGNSFGSYFGSSSFVGPPEMLAGPGRALGGPVRAGSLVPVNEMGTELLTIGNRDYLMAGANGYVTPAGKTAQGGRSVTITNAPNITVQGGGDPTAVRREVAQALAENNRQLMRTLHEEGVL